MDSQHNLSLEKEESRNIKKININNYTLYLKIYNLFFNFHHTGWRRTFLPSIKTNAR